MTNWYDDVEEVAVASEKASVRANFGKLTIKPERYIHWVDGVPNEITPEEFRALKKDKQLELMFNVDIQEFNPELQFQYGRKVGVGSRDWYATLKPSVEQLLGKGSMGEGKYASTMQKLDGAYVEVHDVPQRNKDGSDGEYKTIKIARIFKGRDDCFNAWKERFGDRASQVASASTDTSTGSDLDVPEAYGDLDTWKATIPDVQKALASGTAPTKVAEDFGCSVKHVMQAKAYTG